MSDLIQPERQIEPDGAAVDVFTLPVDEASLEKLLRELFVEHWQDITFGPLIQGAAWEMRAARAPDVVGMMDGYLTIGFGGPHFHICIGEHRGTELSPVSPKLAHHRRTSRAELYRRISHDGTPVSARDCASSTARASATSYCAAAQPVSRPRRQGAENARSGRASTYRTSCARNGSALTNQTRWIAPVKASATTNRFSTGKFPSCTI